MPWPELSARSTRILRVAMLVVIAVVALANAVGLDAADADLWIPFVCIIAVMGVGTRGGPVDALGFVLIEVAVVVLLGVATFSGSRDAVWVASVAVSVLAIGKIALVEMHRMDAARDGAGARRPEDPASKTNAGTTSAPTRTPAPVASMVSDTASRSAPSEAPADQSTAAVSGPRAKEDVAAVPRTISEMPPAPIASPSPVSVPRAAPVSEDPAPRKKRDRNDPTPRAVPFDRNR